MNSFAIYWADALLRSSIQGGLVALATVLLFKVWKSAPANLKVWAWRLVLVKFFVVLFAPIGIERGSEVLSTGSAARPLLPLIILALSAIMLSFSLIGLVQDLLKVWRMRNAAGRRIEYANDQGCEVRESNEIDIPILVGLGRPLILLPTGLSQHQAEVSMAIEHELAHLRRKDLAWSWLAFAAKSFFVFHPFVAMVIHQLHVSTETACDEEAVLRSGVSRVDYGNLLIELSLQNRTPMMPSVGFASSCSADTLRQRVLSLALEPHQCRPATFAMFVAALLLVLPGFRFVPTSAMPNSLDQTKVFSPAEKHPI